MPPIWPARRRRSVQSAISIALGIAFGILLITRGFPFLLVNSLLAGLLLSVAVHETGHVVGCAIARYRHRTFTVWPLQFNRETGKWRLGWAGGHGIGSGFITVDADEDSDFVRRMSIVVAAGPAASLVTGILAASWTSNALRYSSIVHSIAIWSLLLGAVSLIPGSHGSVVNDGSRLRMFWRGGPEAARFRSLVILSTSSERGLPPREWNPVLMEQLPGPFDGTPDSGVALMFRFNWLLDRGQIDEAGAVLWTIGGLDLTDQCRATWWLEAAWFEARYRKDAIAAHSWMDSVPNHYKSRVEQCSVHKAEAAIALLEERWDDFAAALGQALHACEAIADLGIANATREDLYKLEAEACQLKPAASSARISQEEIENEGRSPSGDLRIS